MSLFPYGIQTAVLQIEYLKAYGILVADSGLQLCSPCCMNRFEIRYFFYSQVQLIKLNHKRIKRIYDNNNPKPLSNYIANAQSGQWTLTVLNNLRFSCFPANSCTFVVVVLFIVPC